MLYALAALLHVFVGLWLLRRHYLRKPMDEDTLFMAVLGIVVASFAWPVVVPVIIVSAILMFVIDLLMNWVTRDKA